MRRRHNCIIGGCYQRWVIVYRVKTWTTINGPDWTTTLSPELPVSARNTQWLQWIHMDTYNGCNWLQAITFSQQVTQQGCILESLTVFRTIAWCLFSLNSFFGKLIAVFFCSVTADIVFWYIKVHCNGLLTCNTTVKKWKIWRVFALHKASQWVQSADLHRVRLRSSHRVTLKNKRKCLHKEVTCCQKGLRVPCEAFQLGEVRFPRKTKWKGRISVANSIK